MPTDYWRRIIEFCALLRDIARLLFLRLMKRAVGLDACPVKHDIAFRSIPPQPAEWIESKFKALGPWFCRFPIDGRSFGGAADYSTCPRIYDFDRWHSDGGRVLELGSFEGMHSLIISRKANVSELIGVEGRDYNVRKAELVRDLIGEKRARFVLANLEEIQLSTIGQFDVIFCAGLLYHLQQPWRLLEKMAEVAPKLFLSTHYSLKCTVTRNGYDGWMFKESGFADPLSGLDIDSFWPTYNSLTRMLYDSGFRICRSRHLANYGGGPLVNLYCAKR